MGSVVEVEEVEAVVIGVEDDEVDEEGAEVALVVEPSVWSALMVGPSPPEHAPSIMTPLAMTSANARHLVT